MWRKRTNGKTTRPLPHRSATQRSDSFPSENDSPKVAKQKLKKNRN
ncbi:hypothetical protein [Prevotella corporis]|nr:hypothetical protein [Prevotella corporis]